MSLTANDFRNEFVRRTQEILGQYDKYEIDREFTHLLNCCMGLIIVPFQTKQGEASWNKPIYEVQALCPFDVLTFNPIARFHRHSAEFEFLDMTLETLVRKLRNGFAHSHIEPINVDNVWVGVRILV